MKSTTTALSNLTRQVLAHEAGKNPGLEDLASAEESLCEKLRLYLGQLVGMEGFLALFSRSLALAIKEVPWLAGVEVAPNGTLVGLRTASSNRSPVEVTEGYVNLLEQTVGLLDIFIGTELTLRLLQVAWPELELSNTQQQSTMGAGE